MSQETGIKPASGQTPAKSAGRAVRRFAAVFRRWLRTEVFRRTESGPVGWRKILLAVAAVAAGTTVSLSRTVGAGSLNTIWIEDAKFLLNQALNVPFWKALASPISSYYQEPARLFTEIAIQFPLSVTPGLMSVFAAAEYSMYGLVAYIASAPYFRGSPWLRLLISAPVCAIPLAYTQVNNDLVTVQFFGLYAAFWTVLWIPGTRAGRVLSPVIMATVSWTAALSIVFAPLILARLLVDRSKNAWCLAVLWAGGVWLQFSETVLGRGHHNQYGYNGPFFVIQNYVLRVAPRALFGERSLGGPGADYRGYLAPLHVLSAAGHNALIIAAWLVIAAVVALAAFRLTDPNWTLAGVAALFSIGVFVEEQLINISVVQPRYLVAPAMLLYTALVAMLRPREARPREIGPVLQPVLQPVRWLPVRWLPVAGFAVLLLIAVTLNFRVTNGRTTSPAWTSVVASATRACATPGITAYTFVHEWWWVTVPCGKVG
jgi:hypothetical protein